MDLLATSFTKAVFYQKLKITTIINSKMLQILATLDELLAAFANLLSYFCKLLAASSGSSRFEYVILVKIKIAEKILGAETFGKYSRNLSIPLYFNNYFHFCCVFALFRKNPKAACTVHF